MEKLHWMSAGKDWMIMTLCSKTQPFLLELVFSPFIHIYAAFQLIATFDRLQTSLRYFRKINKVVLERLC